MYKKWSCLAFPGFKASRDIKDFSSPASCAATTSASFSMLISFSLASSASATSSKIFFLSCEDKACRTSFYQVIVLLRQKEGQKEGTPVCYFHL